MSKTLLAAEEDIVVRLIEQFPHIPATAVERCAAEWRLCCSHLGLLPDTATLEILTASRLAAMAPELPQTPRPGSAPASAVPSGAGPARPGR